MKTLFLTFLFCAIAAFALPSRVGAEASVAPAAAATTEAGEADSEVAGWVKKLT